MCVQRSTPQHNAGGVKEGWVECDASHGRIPGRGHVNEAPNHTLDELSTVQLMTPCFVRRESKDSLPRGIEMEGRSFPGRRVVEEVT